ncbi:MAG: VWA domain-containing protein [Aureispira sp.]
MRLIMLALFWGIVTSLLSCSNEVASIPTKENFITIPKPTEDIVFVIDISSSMLAQDFVPNRLEVVKLLLERMIQNKEEQQRLSLVLFAGEALVLSPLTTNSSTLLKQIQAIKAGSIADGTAIGLGLLFALFELSKSTSTIKKIVILTDGVNNTGQYTPDLAAQLAQQQVGIHSFGVGCQGIARSPIAKRPNGSYVFGDLPVEIDEALLQRIGHQTDGYYTRVTCNADMQPFQSLDSLFDASPSIPLSKNLPPINTSTIDSIWQEIAADNSILLEKYHKKQEEEK